ncbi:DUF3347 domain-containing protein [Ascidiimonas sp. W6]|uniref:DUF3347 domain-containing protein n=1 Tax=Ascidiimonas meishanensis TaxID=3128903 RepID=UPI0030ECF4FB
MKSTHQINVAFIFIFILVIGCKTESKKEINTIDTETKEMRESSPRVLVYDYSDKETNKMFINYFKLKDGFVQSNPVLVQKAALAFASVTTDKNKDLKQLVEDIAALDDLEAQRALFAQLTIQLEPLLKEKLLSGIIYKQYCPMAFNNNGGFWFSEKEEIENPYFGDKMLHCGSITEKIGK